MSDHNKGRYCFVCNVFCNDRDEKIVEGAYRSIEASLIEIAFLSSAKKVAKRIQVNQNNIKKKRKIIDTIKKGLAYCTVE